MVDSSVWIDVLTDRTTIQTLAFTRLLEHEQTIVMGDLVLAEILQGTRGDAHFRQTASRLALFETLTIADRHVAIEAARHYRHLRNRSITPRKTIDTLIATRCIVDGLPLLYSDRDFDPFVEHLGMKSALDLHGMN